eukprot:COSAG01_NODE_246_length_20450_cov_195.166822_27_plen_77_part_00
MNDAHCPPLSAPPAFSHLSKAYLGGFSLRAAPQTNSSIAEQLRMRQRVAAGAGREGERMASSHRAPDQHAGPGSTC